MPIPVKLKDIIEEMEVQLDDFRTFLNKETGEIVTLTSDELMAAEEEESLDDKPEWMLENIVVANDILWNFDKYVELPTKYDIHEYKIMEYFCYTVENERIQDSLFQTIRGKGAFRRFKDRINDYGIQDQYYSYREEQFKQIAKEWCEDHGIGYIE